MERKYASIRIKEITIDNYKAIEHGELRLKAAKMFAPFGVDSDILALYGQNGSGKSALVEVLSIVKHLLAGESLPSRFHDGVSVKVGESSVEITFELQFDEATAYDAIYSFSLIRSYDPREIDAPDSFSLSDLDITVEDECLSYRLIKPEKAKKRTIYKAILDDFRHSYLKAIFDPSKMGEKVPDLWQDSFDAKREARSAIFSKVLWKAIDYKESVEAKILESLNYYGKNRLFVIDTSSFGRLQARSYIPFYIGDGKTIKITEEGFEVEEDSFESLSEKVDSISSVLTTIIPGLSLFLKEKEKIQKESGEKIVLSALMTRRESDGLTIPLRSESDGIKRIVSFLVAFRDAFNSKTTTLVIDEIDSGIYEYLLGELLKAFEESGRGQLIFTSHNLRPLEVLKSDSIYFTTTDAKNRFTQMKNVRPSNNLRSMYLREIMVNATQKEEFYMDTDRIKFESALMRSGEIE